MTSVSIVFSVISVSPAARRYWSGVERAKGDRSRWPWELDAGQRVWLRMEAAGRRPSAVSLRAVGSSVAPIRTEMGGCPCVDSSHGPRQPWAGSVWGTTSFSAPGGGGGGVEEEGLETPLDPLPAQGHRAPFGQRGTGIETSCINHPSPSFHRIKTQNH
ncbi:hypothetical protein VUR80DRAFT_7629 [Thermomyces stellatus]